MSGLSNSGWERAVMALRGDPARQQLVISAYLDDPVLNAAERFRASEEWQATLALLSSLTPGHVLDVGAGRGIASYAFAKSGWKVTALEPDSSSIVGRGAIRQLADDANLSLPAYAGHAETLPFNDDEFDLIYGRAVLHHADRLLDFCRELARVLTPGGRLLFVRERVVDNAKQLRQFLDEHPLHSAYGGENAYPKAAYVGALKRAGLEIEKVLGPWDSEINSYPDSLLRVIENRLGHPIASVAQRVPLVRKGFGKLASQLSHHPGRHYSFLARKPQQLSPVLLPAPATTSPQLL